MIGWLLAGAFIESQTGILGELLGDCDGFENKAIRHYKMLKETGSTDEEALRKTKEAIVGWDIERDMGSW